MKLDFWLLNPTALSGDEKFLFLLLFAFAAVMIGIGWVVVTAWAQRWGEKKYLELSGFVDKLIKEQTGLRNFLRKLPEEEPFIDPRTSFMSEKLAFDMGVARLKSELRLLTSKKSRIESNTWEIFFWFIKWIDFGNICQTRIDTYHSKLSKIREEIHNIIEQIRAEPGNLFTRLDCLNEKFRMAVSRYENLKSLQLEGEDFKQVADRLEWMRIEIQSAYAALHKYADEKDARASWMHVAEAARIHKRNRITCDEILVQLEGWTMDLSESQLTLIAIDSQLAESKTCLQNARLNRSVNWDDRVETLDGFVQERNLYSAFPAGFDVDVLAAVNRNTKTLKEKIGKFIPVVKKIEAMSNELSSLVGNISQSITKTGAVIRESGQAAMLGVDWISVEANLKNTSQQFRTITDKKAWLPDELQSDLKIAREVNLTVHLLEDDVLKINNSRQFIIKICQRVLNGKDLLPGQAYIIGLKEKTCEYDPLNWGRYQEFMKLMGQHLAYLEQSQQRIREFSLEQRSKPEQILSNEKCFHDYDQKYADFITNRQSVETILEKIAEYLRAGDELLAGYTEPARDAGRLLDNHVFRTLTSIEFLKYLGEFKELKLEFENRKKGVIERKYQEVHRWTSEFDRQMDDQYASIKQRYSRQTDEVRQVLVEISQAANVNHDEEIKRDKSYMADADALSRASGTTLHEKINLIEDFCLRFQQGAFILQSLRSICVRIRGARNDVEEAFSRMESLRKEAREIFGQKWPPLQHDIADLERGFHSFETEWKNLQSVSGTVENKIRDYNRIEKGLSSGMGLGSEYASAIREAKRDRDILENMERGLNKIANKLSGWLNEDMSLSYDERQPVRERIKKITLDLQEIRAKYERNPFSVQNYQKVYDAYRDLIDSAARNIVINNYNYLEILITGSINSLGDVNIRPQITNNNIVF
jgi:hypothetical protein